MLIGVLHSSGAARVPAQFLLVPSAGAESTSFGHLLLLDDLQGVKQKPLGLGLLMPLGRGQGDTGFTAPATVFRSDCLPVPWL